MHLHRLAAPAILASLAASAPRVSFSQHNCANPADGYAVRHGIPTVHESAVMARRILRLSGQGTLSTVFPHGDASADRPSSVDGTPIGLVDYVGDCERGGPGNPTLLAVEIATSFRNAAAGSNMSLALHWTPPSSSSRGTAAASLPRFSLQGHLELMTADDVARYAVPACFAGYHPDAVVWFPGNSIHTSRWARLVVRDVYWVGGFGDRAYIGWIPVEEWRGVTEREVRDCVLPGEEKRGGWREWLGGLKIPGKTV